MSNDLSETWAKIQDLGKTLARVSAICTLLDAPKAIPDTLETELYAYANQVVMSHGVVLSTLHDAYNGGNQPAFANVVMDIIRQHADFDG
jgi:hypothetical protein